MASSHPIRHPISTVKSPPPPPYVAPILLHQQTPRRRGLLLNRRRRKLPIVRLGGGGSSAASGRRRGFSLARMLSRVRLRWLKLRYSNFFKKLKVYYRGLVKDIIDAGATIEAYQQRLLMETSLAVPMGVSFSAFPASMAASSGRSDLYRYG
ncbi:hypothetical protein LINPERPRIM_LOCUS19620 [Linum perenne]